CLPLAMPPQPMMAILYVLDIRLASRKSLFPIIGWSHTVPLAEYGMQIIAGGETRQLRNLLNRLRAFGQLTADGGQTNVLQHTAERVRTVGMNLLEQPLKLTSA